MSGTWSIGRIAVVGSGAVGLYYGGRLAAAGGDVRFLLRSDAAAVRAGGIRATSVHGDFTVDPVSGAECSEDIGPVDLVIVAWKATANGSYERVLRPLMGEGTQVLTLQNGLGNCEELARLFGAERVLGGLCFVCINRMSPGCIVHSGGGRLSVGELVADGRGRAAAVVRRFREAGVQAEEVADLGAAQWKKLVWNIPFNGLSITCGGVTTDRLLREHEREIRGLMAEVIAAGRALGHDLGDHLADANIGSTRPMGAYRPSSMIDFVDGREVEVEAIWAEPVRRARAAGLAVPRMEALLDGIRHALARRGV